MFVFGLLTYAWGEADEVGRRFAAVQLLGLKTATLTWLTFAFGTSTVTVWPWVRDNAIGGVAWVAGTGSEQ